MPLTWSLEDIKDYKEVCWKEDGKLNPVTETLIFGTIAIGIGHFTVKNIDEVAARFRIMEKIHGAFLYKTDEDGKRKDWFVSDEDFIAHIGLSCNVINETRAQWVRRMFINKQSSVTEDIARSFRSGRSRVMA